MARGTGADCANEAAAPRGGAAAPATMFHVTARELRDSIAERGLDQQADTQSWTFSLPDVYLFDSVENARKWSTTIGEGYDIWQVDAAGLDLVPDEMMDAEAGYDGYTPDADGLVDCAGYDAYWASPNGGGHGAYRVSGALAAERLRLVESGSNPPDLRRRARTLALASVAERKARQAAARALAEPVILYHVSPAARYEQIEEEGLRLDAERTYPQLERRGIYCFPIRDAAWLWTGEQHGKSDIWQVDATGLDVTDDPACTGAVYLTREIPPGRLTLLDRNVRRR